MVFACKGCGIVKSFLSRDPAECAWAKVPMAPQRLQGGMLGAHDVDNLSILAMAGGELCCSCTGSREQWGHDERCARACVCCLERMREQDRASARTPVLVPGSRAEAQHEVTRPDVDSDPDRDDLDVSVVGSRRPPTIYVRNWLDALMDDIDIDWLDEMQLEDQLKKGRDGACGGKQGTGSTGSTGSTETQHIASKSSEKSTNMQKFKSMLSSIKPRLLTRSGSPS
jgi:hypothetical protein